jgi:hypothetical protein
MDQKTIQKIKNDQQDHLLEELLREKAAVLTRASWAVEEVLEKMTRLQSEIEIKTSLLDALEAEVDREDFLRQKKIFCEEINALIEAYNACREKAQLQYYYLIVTREALGLRRHEMVEKIYRVPDKKTRYRLTTDG